ncbi:MAG: hypothetical protein JOY77_13785 [Alphaproteobacteria bacterium]|nr:hypothetical protein [Alphaproteobacteria bacterium]MBV9063979.1 hypothetical protein [Alphaproteobacteria bacterium]
MRLRILLALTLVASATLGTTASGEPDRFGVTYVPGGASRVAIEKAANQADGSAWIDYVRKAEHSTLVVRRTKPGRAEVHTELTDVWYVIDGGGTLVTGGKLVDAKTIAPGELRARASSGGIARHIGKGDLLDIPAGVPHWVRGIDGKELVYLTVKVATPPR